MHVFRKLLWGSLVGVVAGCSGGENIDERAHEAEVGVVASEFAEGSVPAAGSFTPGTNGGVSVGPNGQLTYSLPIFTAPAAGSMAPSLSIDYSSQAGPGLVGIGGSLSGLSAVGRCPKTIAQDGATSEIAYDDTDRFCLDGQRLVAVSGVYGADQTEYRTELDSLTRIVSYGRQGLGPASFRAWMKSGQILDFGTTASSRIEVSGGTTVRTWAVAKIADRYTNSIDVAYSENNAAGSFVPTKVSFGANATRATAHTGSIVLQYESVRAPVQYVGGAPISNPLRLSRVLSYAGAAVVRDYRLAYETSGPLAQSRLTSVTECDSPTSNVCLQPTTFEWQDPKPLTGTPASWGTGVVDGVLLGDFNADGKTDLAKVLFPDVMVALSTGTSFGAWTKWASVAGGTGDSTYVGDINGDGKADIYLASLPSHNAPQVVALLSNGSSFTPVNTGIDNYWFTGNNWVKAFAADVNNDGRSDLVAVQFYPSTTVVAWVSRVTGTTIPATPYSQVTYNSPLTPLAVSDATGDGASDVTGVMSGKVVLKPFSGDLITTTVPLTVSDAVHVADVNGDGKDDVVEIGGVGVASKAWIATGRSLLSTSTAIGDALDKKDALLDMNGDGRPDLVRPEDPSTIWVQLATLDGFPTGATNRYALVPVSKGLKASFGDFNGDGFPDAFQNDAGAARVTLNPVGLHNVVSAVVDGRGARTEVTYAQPSTGAAYVASGAVTTYPEQATAPSLPVVSKMVSPNGVGGTRARTYTYVGGHVSLTGRGFAGFERVVQRDYAYANASAYLKTDTTYRTDYPYAGSVGRQTRAYYNGTTTKLLADVVNTYALVAGSGTSIPVQTQTVEQSWDLSGTALPTVTTTASSFQYGTPTVMVTDVDGYKKTTRLTYTHDVATWTLLRLTRATVAHEAPSTASLPAITRTSAFTYVPATGALASETIEPDDTADLKRTTTYAYDDFGNKRAVTVSGPSFATRTTTTTYDATGRFAETTTNALGQAVKKTYDVRFGTPLTATDPNGLVAKNTYDGFGRMISETSPDGIVTTYAHAFCDATCPAGAVQKSVITKTAASAVTTYFDLLGRDIRSESEGAFDGRIVVTEKQYDAAGHVYRTSVPRFATDTAAVKWTSTLYDPVDRPLKVTDPLGHATTYAYDGPTTTRTSHLGQVSTSTKNAQGKIVAITESGLGTTFKYDAVGSLLATTDAKQSVSRATYDRLGRKRSAVDPSTGTWLYTYDGLGQVLTQRDAKLQTTTMTYDALGRLTERVAPDQTAVFTYDDVNGIGKIATEQTVGTLGSSFRGFAYDAKSRLVSNQIIVDSALSTGFRIFQTTTTYDALGRPATTTYPNGVAVRTVYGARSFPVRVDRTDGGTTSTLWTALDVDAQNLVRKESRGNGLVTTRVFDALGRLTSVATPTKDGLSCVPTTCAPDYTTYDPSTKSDATGCTYDPDAGEHQRLPTGCTTETPQSYVAVYDEVGRLAQRNDRIAGMNETFTYDDFDRLKTVTGKAPKTFDYDEVGNVVAKSDVGTFTYATRPYAPDATSGALATTFTYDANGNQKTGNGRTVTWTTANLPRRVTRGAAFVQFDYDAHGERMKATDQTGAKTYYAAPGFENLVRTNGTETARLTLMSPAGLLAQIIVDVSATGAKSEATSYLLTDHLGSVQVVTSETGAVVQRLSYDAHGLRRFTNGVDADVGEIVARATRGFTGHEMLDGVGLVHMNARLYDPLLGRFLSADSVLQHPFTTQGQNRYAYTDNHPLSATDPSGHGWFSVFASIFIAIMLPEVAWFKDAMFFLSDALAISAKLVTGIVVGAISGAVSTGSLKGAILGGISGGLFAAAGFVGKAGSMMRTMAHGVAGAVTAALSGGSIRAGFLSATFRSVGGGVIDAVPDEVPARVVAAAAVGGVGSVLGGGKFENGAVTGAFGELFNHQSDKICLRPGYTPAPYDGPSFSVWEPAPQRGLTDQSFGMILVESYVNLAKALTFGWIQTGIDVAVDYGILPPEAGLATAAMPGGGGFRLGPMSAAERDLLELANSYRGQLISRQDAEILRDLANEVGMANRGRVAIDETSRGMTDPLWKGPHLHIPSLGEHAIPIADGPFSPFRTVRGR